MQQQHPFASDMQPDLEALSTPSSEFVELPTLPDSIFATLPDFLQRVVELAASLSIPPRTAEDYISNFCKKGLILNEKYGSYINLSLPGNNSDSTD